mmetsp:Transcript_24184/g.39734  ORF Transcript_24184/g.39734 Transcript_24184/m.39734 type:complete len:366 (-) Transcript_24184:132-1229(-)
MANTFYLPDQYTDIEDDDQQASIFDAYTDQRGSLDVFNEKEAELRKRNEELDVRKEKVVKAAEIILKQQDEKLAKAGQSKSSSQNVVSRGSFQGGEDKQTAASRPSSGHIPVSEKSSPASSVRPTSQSKQARPSVSRTGITPAIAFEILKDEDDVFDEGGLGSDAVVRLLKAKIQVLEEKLSDAVVSMGAKDQSIAEAAATIAELAESRSRLQKQLHAAEAQVEHFRKAADDSSKKQEILERQLAALKKDLDGAQRVQKQADSETSSREVRLNRAMEEIEKLKGQLREARSQGKESGDGMRKDLEKAVADTKRLERQKADLITAFRKQMKLIDVLKRQKLHIEATRMLEFTEEEFMKTLELGERL